LDALKIGEARQNMVILVNVNGQFMPYIVTNPKEPFPDGMGGSRQLIVAEPQSGVGKNVCVELCSWESPKVFRKG